MDRDQNSGMLKAYFRLQYKLLSRKLRDFGIHPIIGIILSVIGFIILSIYLFYKTQFAAYIYIFMALSFVGRLSEIRRNDFLNQCFNSTNYIFIRLIENAIVTVPFILFLIFKGEYFCILVLVSVAVAMTLIKFGWTLSFTVPTPFGKRPFEFIIGFRNSYFLFPLVYALCIIGVSVDNFNLSAFSLVLIFLISILYYSNPEPPYYVWSYNLSPRAFLLEKIQIGLRQATILISPPLIIIPCFYSIEYRSILIILLIGYCYLITIILAKYSAYPEEMSLPQAILLGTSILFPPFLIGLIPFFYLESKKQLKHILE